MGRKPPYSVPLLHRYRRQVELLRFPTSSLHTPGGGALTRTLETTSSFLYPLLVKVPRVIRVDVAKCDAFVEVFVKAFRIHC